MNIKLLSFISSLVYRSYKENEDRYVSVGHELERFIKGKNYKSIADIGCGTGRYGNMLKNYTSLLSCIDVSSKTLSNLPSSYDIPLNINLVECNKCASNIDADLYVMTELIEHLPKDDGFLLLNSINSDIFVSTPSRFSNSHMIRHIGNKAYLHKSVWSIKDFLDNGFTDVYTIKNGVVNNIFYREHIIAIKEC